jgi:hypothetical protein
VGAHPSLRYRDGGSRAAGAERTSCCSPAIQTSAAPGTCNAVSDWVGSCVIAIERRRDRAPKAQS